MELQQKVEELYKQLKSENPIWNSKTGKVYFVERKGSWAWAFRDVDLIAEHHGTCLQQHGFSSRTAAAEYVDNIFNLGVSEAGFYRGQTLYSCNSDKLFLISYKKGSMAKQQSWSINYAEPDNDKSIIIGDDNSKYAKQFDTRKKALAYVVEHHPEFLK